MTKGSLESILEEKREEAVDVSHHNLHTARLPFLVSL